MVSTREILFCAALLTLPAVLHAGVSACDVDSLCPTVTETQGHTDAYCLAVSTDLVCLASAKANADCSDNSDQTAIQTRIDSSSTEYNTYDCGVAGLAASTTLCVIVCLLSLMARR